MNTAVARMGGDEFRLIGLISAGHFLSHFFIFCLPPLLPVVSRDLGIGFALLGTMMTAYSVVNACCQVPMGFLVDRLGGRVVLAAGLALHSAAFIAVGFTHTYWQMLPLFALAGIGQAVFHPADYAILAARIDHARLGRAVSVHTFAGNVGWGLAPPVMLALVAVADWRTAFMVVGIVGIAIAALIFLQPGLIGGAPVAPEADGEPASKKRSSFRDGLALMKSPALLILFGYFLFSSLAGSGISNVTVVSMMRLYDVSLVGANSALTGYLWGTAAGVLLGGWLVDRFGRPNLIAGGLMAASALCLIVVPLGVLPLALVVVAMTLVGTFSGASAPSRDILVRQAAGPNTVGVAFGFTSTGFSIAGATMPPLYGWLLDTGRLDIAYGIMVAGLMVAVAACGLSRETPASPR